MVSLRPWFPYQHFELGGRCTTLWIERWLLAAPGKTKQSYPGGRDFDLFRRAGLFGRCEEGIVVVLVLLNTD